MRHDMSGNFDMLWSTAFKWPDSRILPQPYYIHTKNGKERYDTVFCVPLNFNISCVIWFFVWLNKHKTFCSLQDGHLPSNLPCMRCKAQVTGQWASTETQLSFEMWYPHLQSSCRARVNLAHSSVPSIQCKVEHSRLEALASSPRTHCPSPLCRVFSSILSEFRHDDAMTKGLHQIFLAST